MDSNNQMSVICTVAKLARLAPYLIGANGLNRSTSYGVGSGNWETTQQRYWQGTFPSTVQPKYEKGS